MRNLIAHQNKAIKISRLLLIKLKSFSLINMPKDLATIEVLNGVDLFCLSMDALKLLGTENL